MIVIADSSALVALATCGSLWVLNELFNEVKVPQAVFNEVIIANKPQAQWINEINGLNQAKLLVRDMVWFQSFLISNPSCYCRIGSVQSVYFVNPLY
jgi:predicted nucleic acid-binding protein